MWSGGSEALWPDPAALSENDHRLREQVAELEKRLTTAERERDAARARAAHAERMQALGRLAGGIAHDFNNVLQAVGGAASLLGRRPVEEQCVRRYARVISDAVERGATTARRLLAFARRGGSEPMPVDVAKLLSGLREMLTYALGSSFQVALEFEPGLPPLLADKGQLETALVNLATNSRDAMPYGGCITFAAATEEIQADWHDAGLRPGRYIRLSVKDTGSGMDTEVAASAAEPFFTTKDSGVGTGLGLSMAAAYAKEAGGRLAIDTVPGCGTTVSLWLPVAEATGFQAPEAGLEAAAARDEGLRVLLVDDAPDVRETLAMQLERSGYKVSSVGSAPAALALLASGERPDVLVTDFTMPGMNGMALIRRAQTLYPGLPAVLITGLPGETGMLPAEGGANGPVMLLRKPLAAAEIAGALIAVQQDRRRQNG